MSLIAKSFLSLAAISALVGCLTGTEIREKVVVVGGPDSAMLAREGQTLKLYFLGKFGADTLRTGRKYLTAGGDSVRFEMAKFYISEIALVDSTGKSHYLLGTHLVDMLDSASQARGYALVSLKALPGTYRGVRFSIGVPYDQNHRDPATQSAPLGTASQMFWTWNSGYIFHRVEGKVDSVGAEKNFAYHVGGDNRKVQINLYSLINTPTTFTVAAGHHKVAASSKVAHDVESHLAIEVEYAELFSKGLVPDSTLRPSVNTNERQAHGGALADRVFLNSQSMFSLAEAPAEEEGGHH